MLKQFLRILNVLLITTSVVLYHTTALSGPTGNKDKEKGKGKAATTTPAAAPAAAPAAPEPPITLKQVDALARLATLQYDYVAIKTVTLQVEMIIRAAKTTQKNSNYDEPGFRSFGECNLISELIDNLTEQIKKEIANAKLSQETILTLNAANDILSRARLNIYSGNNITWSTERSRMIQLIESTQVAIQVRLKMIEAETVDLQVGIENGLKNVRLLVEYAKFGKSSRTLKRAQEALKQIHDTNEAESQMLLGLQYAIEIDEALLNKQKDSLTIQITQLKAEVVTTKQKSESEIAAIIKNSKSESELQLKELNMALERARAEHAREIASLDSRLKEATADLRELEARHIKLETAEKEIATLIKNSKAQLDQALQDVIARSTFGQVKVTFLYPEKTVNKLFGQVEQDIQKRVVDELALAKILADGETDLHTNITVIIKPTQISNKKAGLMTRWAQRPRFEYSSTGKVDVEVHVQGPYSKVSAQTHKSADFATDLNGNLSSFRFDSVDMTGEVSRLIEYASAADSVARTNLEAARDDIRRNAKARYTSIMEQCGPAMNELADRLAQMGEPTVPAIVPPIRHTIKQ